MPWTSDQLPWTFQYPKPARSEGPFEPLNWMKGPPILAKGGSIGTPGGGPPIMVGSAGMGTSSGPPVMLGGGIAKSFGGPPVMLGGGVSRSFGGPPVMLGGGMGSPGGPSPLLPGRLSSNTLSALQRNPPIIPGIGRKPHYPNTNTIQYKYNPPIMPGLTAVIQALRLKGR